MPSMSIILYAIENQIKFSLDLVTKIRKYYDSIYFLAKKFVTRNVVSLFFVTLNGILGRYALRRPQADGADKKTTNK